MNMRKDSEMFLKKVLDYRKSTGENHFELSYKYFEDIPSIETAMIDILGDLINNNILMMNKKKIRLLYLIYQVVR